jgi:hypothetical protein
MAAVWRVLGAIEDDAVPGLQRAFLAALTTLHAAVDVDVDDVAQALATHDTARVVALVPLDAFVTALEAILPELERVAAAAHDATAAELRGALPDAVTPAEASAIEARLGLPLAELSPDVIQAIRDHGAALVREVTDETRAAIVEALERAALDGLDVQAAAQAIAEIVGLTRRQAAAVARYRAALEAEGRDPAQVDRMVARVVARLRRQRAQVIARTETNRAMNLGRRGTWRDLVAQGLLDPARWRRQWLTVLPAPGVCPICAPLDGTTAPIEGPYPDGSDGPPAHPLCRCSEVLIPAAA